MHKGCLHHQVCRAIWKSILSQIFFWEKNCNSGRLVPIAHGARVFKNLRCSIINIALKAELLSQQCIWPKLLWQRFCHSGKRGPGNETLKKRKEQTAFYNRFQPLAGPGNKSNSVSSHLIKAKSHGWLTSAAKFQMLPIEATMLDVLW